MGGAGQASSRLARGSPLGQGQLVRIMFFFWGGGAVGGAWGERAGQHHARQGPAGSGRQANGMHATTSVQFFKVGSGFDPARTCPSGHPDHACLQAFGSGDAASEVLVAAARCSRLHLFLVRQARGLACSLAPSVTMPARVRFCSASKRPACLLISRAPLPTPRLPCGILGIPLQVAHEFVVAAAGLRPPPPAPCGGAAAGPSGSGRRPVDSGSSSGSEEEEGANETESEAAGSAGDECSDAWLSRLVRGVPARYQPTPQQLFEVLRSAALGGSLDILGAILRRCGV